MIALVVPVLLVGVYLAARPTINALVKFCWACFLQPIGKHKNQQAALEQFYQSQAAIYDQSRRVLLKGREQMLHIAKAHLKSKRNLIWVEFGGGTGYNIEYMASIMPIGAFKAVYLVDLSPSLCKVAEERFRRMGVTNVYVHCRDVNTFELPPNEKADFVSMSYSLSMIPSYHSTVDRCAELLDKNGIIGIVDFYVQDESNYNCKTSTVGGELFRHVNWLSRNFWRLWFELDRVHLDPARRDYVEYRFGTIKSLNCRNTTLGFIPYYIWVGCPKREADDLEYRFQLATESPVLAPGSQKQLVTVTSKGYDAAMISLQQNMPYPSFYYQKEIWRIYYDTTHPQHHQFNDQYIYAFTWEDPIEDHAILNFKESDVVLCITSAGDNLLHYAALDRPPRRIHGVDMNPHQNHLAELKLAALATLDHDDTWKLFGEGVYPNFRKVLMDKLAASLSSTAFQFWYENGDRIFSGKGLYNTGSTRWALRLASSLFKIAGVGGKVEEFCHAPSMDVQIQIWEQHLKPVLLNKWFNKVVCGNSVFLWKSLGVPMNQAALIDGGIWQYIVDTLEPVVYKYRIHTENYFYYLCMLGHYHPKNCPSYLTKKGYFNLSRRTGALDGVRLHTDSINDVVERLVPSTVTIAIVMDHMDWFDPEGKDAHKEISQLNKALAPGGRVLLRSSSKEPWYLRVFEEYGFKTHAAAVRESGAAIDMVNMYASTWVCTKPDMSELAI